MIQEIVCTPNCSESPEPCICVKQPAFLVANKIAHKKDIQFSEFMQWYYDNKITDERSRRIITDLMYEWYKQKPNEPLLCDNTDVARNQGI